MAHNIVKLQVGFWCGHGSSVVCGWHCFLFAVGSVIPISLEQLTNRHPLKAFRRFFDQMGYVRQHRLVEEEQAFDDKLPDDIRCEGFAGRSDQERCVGPHRPSGQICAAVAT